VPFKSRKQMAWMFKNHPKMARKWAKHTSGIRSLPKRVKKGKGGKGK
jgi:hypothetical protein